ncbi:submandibular gland secretory Glx-rich protein CA-like isoform X3 [Hippocampus comes]|uniref:submandibular gland secretory Glx-rich protein CA-like isoform X3 n=1 Tax=Hippocampus comes TaxID=109280 RepID=UPI00094EC13B|nr:PREDICTED: submandibular gland secretory Glx-rich protein CA-like isoform X3 [Hippocampus comes]
MCARLTPKYEEDVCGIKVKSEQHFQLLGDVCKQPRNVPHTAEVNEKYLHPEQQGAEFTHIKKEQEDFSNSSLTFVPLKSEDDNKGTSEEDGRAEPPSSSSSGHISREDVSEKYLHPEQQEPPSTHIKEEEEEENDITNLSLTFAPLKSEDDDMGESEEDTEVEPPSSISSSHITEGDGNHNGPLQAPSDDLRRQ